MVGGCRMQSIDEASFDVTLMSCMYVWEKMRGCEDVVRETILRAVLTIY